VKSDDTPLPLSNGSNARTWGSWWLFDAPRQFAKNTDSIKKKIKNRTVSHDGWIIRDRSLCVIYSFRSRIPSYEICIFTFLEFWNWILLSFSLKYIRFPLDSFYQTISTFYIFFNKNIIWYLEAYCFYFCKNIGSRCFVLFYFIITAHTEKILLCCRA